jgi:hypothetical protein
MEGTIPSVSHKKISTLSRRTGEASVGKKYKNTKVNLTIRNLASRMVKRKIQVCSRFPLVNIAANKQRSIFRDT